MRKQRAATDERAPRPVRKKRAAPAGFGDDADGEMDDFNDDDELAFAELDEEEAEEEKDAAGAAERARGDDAEAKQAELELLLSTGYAAPASESDYNARATTNINNARIDSIAAVTNLVVQSSLYYEGDEQRPVHLNISYIVRCLGHLNFREIPRKVKSAIVHLQSPTCSVIVLEEGKVSCPGTRNVEDARTAIESVLRLIRRTRPGYARLRCRALRLQIIVGTVNYPYEIDTPRMLRHEVNMSYNPLTDGVTMSVHVAELLRTFEAPLAEVRAAEQRNTKVAVLAYPSGCVVVTGAKRPSVLAMALIYAMRKVRKYFTGSVERTFSHEAVRRYCATLHTAVRAYEGGAGSTKSSSSGSGSSASAGFVANTASGTGCYAQHRRAIEYIVVRSDGSLGSLREWYEQAQPVQQMHALLAKIGERYVDGQIISNRMYPLLFPAEAGRAKRARLSSCGQLLAAAADAERARADKENFAENTTRALTHHHGGNAAPPSSFAVVVANENGAQHSMALAAPRSTEQMLMLNARGEMRNAVVRAVRGQVRAHAALAAQQKAMLVEVHGAHAVRQALKPKKVQILEQHVAADLYHGTE